MHKVVITLRMVGGQTDIFIHIKGNRVLKRNLPFPMPFNQFFIDTERCRTRRQAEHKRF